MDQLLLFSGACLLLTLVPGPAVVLVVGQSLSKGVKAGLVCSFGLSVGTMIQVLIGLLGFSLLLAQSAEAFHIIRVLGAAYLFWLAFTQFIPSKKPKQERVLNSKKIFGQAVLIQIFNPKTALFFLSFLPLFIVPEKSSPALQFVFLGSIFSLIALCTDSIYALVAGKVHNGIKEGFWKNHLPKVSGLSYLVLGTLALLQGDLSEAN